MRGGRSGNKHYVKTEKYLTLGELTRQRVQRLKDMLERMSQAYGGKGPDECAAPAKKALEKLKSMES